MKPTQGRSRRGSELRKWFIYSGYNLELRQWKMLFTITNVSINLCNVRILFWAKKSVYLVSNIFSFTSDKIGQLWVCFNTLHHNTIIQHLISENICYLLFLYSRIPALNGFSCHLQRIKWVEQLCDADFSSIFSWFGVS